MRSLLRCESFDEFKGMVDALPCKLSEWPLCAVQPGSHGHLRSNRLCPMLYLMKTECKFDLAEIFQAFNPQRQLAVFCEGTEA